MSQKYANPGILLLLASLYRPVLAQRFDSISARSLAPGIVHQRMIANAGPWNVHVVEIDLKESRLELRALRAADSLRGRETVSSMVRRRNSDSGKIVAAINADFFNLVSGENEDNQILNGELWKGVQLVDSKQDKSHSIRTQFAMSAAGRPLIDRFAFVGSVLGPAGITFSLNAVNYRTDPATTVLFTPRFGGLTPRDSANQHSFELPLEAVTHSGDTLLYRVAGPVHSGGGTPIGNGAVLATSDAHQLERLGPAGTVIRVVEAFAPDRGSINLLLGGWPRLVVHGQNVAASADSLENTAASFSTVKHPRSGIGFSRDSSTLYFITVDGRSESSSGMSLVEFADLMGTLGIFEGMNFDGGGSTTMVIDGAVVNKPSDRTGERTVGNALAVILKSAPHE